MRTLKLPSGGVQLDSQVSATSGFTVGYKYYKVVLKGNSDRYMALQQLSFEDDSGVVHVPTASSASSGDASKLYDGNTFDYTTHSWISDGVVRSEEWLTFDFDEQFEFDVMNLHIQSITAVESLAQSRAPTDVAVYGSNDKSTWQILVHLDELPKEMWEIGEAYPFPLIYPQGRMPSGEVAGYDFPWNWPVIPEAMPAETIYAVARVCANDDNFVHFRLGYTSSLEQVCTIDWGDGTVENTTINSSFFVMSHTYNYGTLSGSYNENDTKYVLIKITPGAYLQSFYLDGYAVTGRNDSSSAAVDSRIAGLYVNSTILTYFQASSNTTSATVQRSLEYMEFRSVCTLSNLKLAYCTNLVEFKGGSGLSVSSLNNAFNGCAALRKVSGINVLANTNADYAFAVCRSLEEAPDINYGNLVSCSSLFYFSALRRFRYFDRLPSVGSLASVFQKCYNFELDDDQLDLVLNTTSSVYSMLQYSHITQLRSLTINGVPTSVTFLLGYVQHLRKIGSIKVVSGTTSMQALGLLTSCPVLRRVGSIKLQMTNATDNAVNNCQLLKSILYVYTPAATQSNGMFRSNYAMTHGPYFGLQLYNIHADYLYHDCHALTYFGKLELGDASHVCNISSVFKYCRSLSSVANFTAMYVNETGGAFAYMLRLKRFDANIGWAASSNNTQQFMYCGISQITGNLPVITSSIDVSYTDLSAQQLNALFAKLGTPIASATITITNCSGARSGSGVDRTIATNKGWAVVG